MLTSVGEEYLHRKAPNLDHEINSIKSNESLLKSNLYQFKLDINELENFDYEKLLENRNDKFADLNVLDITNDLIDLIKDSSDQILSNKRNANILLLRVNGLNRKLMTLQEVGFVYDLTRERIRQISNKVKIRLLNGRINNKSLFDSYNMFITSYFGDVIDITTSELVYLINKFHEYFNVEKTLELMLLIFNIDKDDYLSNWIKTVFINEKNKFHSKILRTRRESDKKEKQIDKFDKWISNNTFFPQNLNLNAAIYFDSLNILRHVNADSELSGEYYCPKMKKVIEYESGLEFRILSKLSESKWVKSYKVQSLEIQYNYEGVVRNYYPDIQVLTEDNLIIIIECKAALNMVTHQNVAKFNALVAYCNKMGFGYLYTDERSSFKKILNKEEKKDFSDKLLSEIINNGFLSYLKTREIMNEFKCDVFDLSAAIFRKKLKLRNEPYFILTIN